MTARLNQAIDCPGCKLQVNPFIYKKVSGSDDRECLCPNCGERFIVWLVDNPSGLKWELAR